MHSHLSSGGLAALWLFASTATAAAQLPTAGAVQVGGPTAQTAVDPRGQLSVDAFTLASVEVGPPVKGAPYSAEATTEIVQTLADGNRIVRRTSALLYRDSRGRTRREVMLDGVAGIMVAGAPLRMITISDPEAGMTYVVDSDKVLEVPPRTWTGQVSGGGRSGAAAGQAGGGAFQVGVAPPVTPNQVREEKLGMREIEGVSTEGTRTTVTIPAGAIGNERPIESVTERWFSPGLRIVVLSRSTDPRFGTTTYRLTKISRAEPAAALFEHAGR